MTFKTLFLPCTSIFFHAIYKDVNISLVGNLLLLSPGSYFLAYTTDTNSVLNFPVTVAGLLVSVDVKLQYSRNYLQSTLLLFYQ